MIICNPRSMPSEDVMHVQEEDAPSSDFDAVLNAPDQKMGDTPKLIPPSCPITRCIYHGPTVT